MKQGPHAAVLLATVSLLFCHQGCRNPGHAPTLVADRVADARRVLELRLAGQCVPPALGYYFSTTGPTYREMLPEEWALLCMKNFGAREDLQLIEHFLTHESPYVRVAALWAFARVAPSDEVPKLLALLGDRSPDVRQNVLYALHSRQWIGLQPVLEAALGDPNPSVCDSARELIERMSRQ